MPAASRGHRPRLGSGRRNCRSRRSRRRSCEPQLATFSFCQKLTPVRCRTGERETSMEIRRFTTAETPTGVVTRTDNVLDTASRESTDVINIWGFDAVPGLPLRPEHVLGAFQQMGAFGPLGGIRADLYIMPPFGDEPPDLAEIASKIDLGTGGGMVPG